MIHLSYASFLNTFPKLDICNFQLIVKALFLCKILVTCKQATRISDLPSCDIFVPQKLPLWKSFDDVISCDLWFKPPPIKNSGYANELENGDCLKKIFEDLFFLLWRTLAPVSLVLGLEHSCPWPREVLSSERLSLASDFFVSLALASSLVSSTPPLLCTFHRMIRSKRSVLKRYGTQGLQEGGSGVHCTQVRALGAPGSRIPEEFRFPR